MKFSLLLTAAAAFVCLSPAHAAVLLAWDPQGLSGTWPEDWASSSQGGTVTVHSGVLVAAGLGRGGGTTLAGLNNGWGIASVNQTSFETAVTDNDYISFSLAPQAGYSLAITALDFNVRLPQAAWDAGNARYQWQYKVGEGSFVNLGTAQALTGTYNTNGATQPTLDLSGLTALQNITETVEFRLYAWNTSGQFVFGRLAGDDLALSGSVSAVPEPARPLLLFLGTLTLLGRRRRPSPLHA